MKNSNDPSRLKPDPDLAVRTTVEIPEDVHQTLRFIAQQRRCSLGEVATEGLRLLFGQLESSGGEKQDRKERDAPGAIVLLSPAVYLAPGGDINRTVERRQAKVFGTPEEAAAALTTARMYAALAEASILPGVDLPEGGA